MGTWSRGEQENVRGAAYLALAEGGSIDMQKPTMRALLGVFGVVAVAACTLSAPTQGVVTTSGAATRAAGTTSPSSAVPSPGTTDPTASSSAAVAASGDTTTHDGAGAAPLLAASTVAPAAALADVAAATHAMAAPEIAHAGKLAHFHDALRALEAQERKAHVRILWLGDSHAQADFWTGGVRTALQKRFGNAGPGFVHLGMKGYRHDDIDVEVDGGWRMRPRQPSTVAPFGDGAFGLGGILHAGFSGKRAASLRLTDASLAGKPLTWDVCYKAGLASDDFAISLGDAHRERIKSPTVDEALHHLEFANTGLAKLDISIRDGRPDFCGVRIEVDPQKHPGVVLDNVGINGARYATALAWNEAAWAKEVARHPPDLFVFEFGGNEASDPVVKPAEYEKNTRALILRGKRIRREASCLVVGPADRVDAEARIPPINDAMRRAALAEGCMFWDTHAVMGGKGSLTRWRDEKKASPDGVHLMPRGYSELAALLTADLLAGYRRP